MQTDDFAQLFGIRMTDLHRCPSTMAGLLTEHALRVRALDVLPVSSADAEAERALNS